ncbi:MAG: T9SS type A sorting domain-containing protein [Crocinitomicaceae bacterium]|nr:T9SS type A sorting domain-containing protein [Crocinitomicaceae bacterium]
MKKITFLILLLPLLAAAQTTKKVCFIGNSYIYTNDLPTIISNLATADGNTLVKDQNTIGGYTLESHSTNATTLTKIAANTWDYVVLQDQSQIPSFPWSQVQTDVLPFAESLCESIRAANSCAIPVFFDTWGRQIGDPQWDSIDTFTEMNQRLYNAYEYMADANSGLLSPVGIAFEHVANDGSTGDVTFAQLYSGDGSHPAIFGSYLAACVFYEQIFETSSVGNTYLPAGINSIQAGYLQGVAHHVLTSVDSISTSFIEPIAEFSYTVNGLEIAFTNESLHDFEWLWNFGDGNSSITENPSHNYSSGGAFAVELIAYYCDRSDTIEYTINTSALSLTKIEDAFLMYPNPSNTGFVKISNLLDESFVAIYSADGKLIQTVEVNSESIELNLPAGTYLVKTKTSSQLLLVR